MALVAAAPAQAADIDWTGKTLPPGVSRSTITVAGVQTKVFQAGPEDSREAVVFLHGHPGSADDWPHLVSIAGRYGRAVAFDFPGFGDAGKPANFDYSVPGEAKWLGQALDALGIDRVHFALHDFGGPFGLEWAKTNPDKLLSVVLLNTGVFTNYYGHPWAYIWHVPVVGEASMDTQTREGFGLGLQSASLRPLPAAYIDTAWSHYDKATRAAALKLYRSFPNPDSADKMGKAQAAVLVKKKRPALVIWGESDPYVPVYMAYQQENAFPGAQVDLIAAGHWAFVELPDEVDALAAPFWQQNVKVVPKPKPAAKKKAASKKKRCSKGRRGAARSSSSTCRSHRRRAARSAAPAAGPA